MSARSKEAISATFIVNFLCPVVYMARDVMILMRANPLQGPLKGRVPENRDFFGPWNGNEESECHLGPKKPRYIKNSAQSVKKTFPDGKFVIIFNIFPD